MRHSRTKTFREYYPRGGNYVIVPNAKAGYTRRFQGLDVQVCEPSGWRPPAART